MSLRRFGIFAALACACGAPRPLPAPPVAGSPPAAATSARGASKNPLAEPPPAGITPNTAFPAITHGRLGNGLELAVIARRSFPVIDVRLLVRSGQATDGDRTGLAALAGELLKDGGAGPWSSRELAERAETLGSSLSIVTDRDSTRIGLSVIAGDLDRALEIVAALATRPRLLASEFDKLRAREIDRVKGRARTSPGWLAAMLLYRELYEVPAAVHPYARYDALPEELAAIRLEDAKRWVRQHVVPENAALVVTGDVEPKAVSDAAERRLGAWRGTRPPPLSFPEPHGPSGLTLFVVDRPASAQSQVLVAMLGPERKSPHYAGLMAANQILGGGVAGRLFLDVREKRSLAYSTSSSVEEPARARMPLVLSAGTQTAKTAETVQALLDNLGRIGKEPPSTEELERAARFLSDSFLFRMETASGLADLTMRLIVHGLPDESYDEYRSAVRALTPEAVAVVAGRHYRRDSPVVVVAGDAAVIKKPLARIAAVQVVDPERFTIRETIPKE